VKIYSILSEYLDEHCISRTMLSSETGVPLEVLNGKQELTALMLRSLCIALDLSASKFFFCADVLSEGDDSEATCGR